MYQIHSGIKAGVYVFLYDPGEPAYLDIESFRGDGLDGLELALGGDGKSSLYDVDPELVKLSGDGNLLLRGEGDAGGLLSVPKGGVKDPYTLASKGASLIENDPTRMIPDPCQRLEPFAL
jgi:hypothetical protein